MDVYVRYSCGHGEHFDLDNPHLRETLQGWSDAGHALGACVKCDPWGRASKRTITRRSMKRLRAALAETEAAR